MSDSVFLSKKAEDMIKKIRSAFKDNVKTLDWMDEKTKKAVEEKVNSFICRLLLST